MPKLTLHQREILRRVVADYRFGQSGDREINVMHINGREYIVKGLNHHTPSNIHTPFHVKHPARWTNG